MRVNRLGILLGALGAGVVLTGACLLSYLVMQQVERQGANDPQVQIAEDGARALGAGVPAREIASGAPVDLARSLATVVIVLDDAGNVVASNARLGAATPVPPAGVRTHVRDQWEARLTWAPNRDVRLASVTRRVEGARPGFIVVARSLREVESRIANIGRLIFAIWCVGAAGIAALALAALAAVPRIATLRMRPAPA